MTVLFGDFTDILGAAVPGYIEIRPKEMRPARQGTSVIVDKTVRVPLMSGAFRTGEIDPGVVVVTLHSGTGHGRVHESWEVHLPETGEMNLRDHVADRVTYSPEVIGQAQAAATTSARYAGVAQAAAENATSAESRVAGVVADGVATLKQHVATEVDAAREALEGAEAAREGAEAALQDTTDARDATTAIQGTVAGYVASTAEQVNVARGHADRADSAASTAAGDVRAELASMVASAGAHVATASGHATTAAAKAGEAATSASAAATSATSAGDILVQVRSEREVAQAAAQGAAAARAAAESARDGAVDAADRAEAAAAGAGQVVSDVADALAGKADTGHSHTIADVTGLQDALDGKAAVSHQHSWGDVTGKPTVYPPESHSHPSTDISDSTSTGRSVLTASSQAAARGAIGAGTSNLVIGTTASTAKAGNYQPTAANITDATTVGRNVLKAADAAAARTAISAAAAADVAALQSRRTTSTTTPAGGTVTLAAPNSPVDGQMHIFEVLPTASTTVTVSELGPRVDGVPASLTVASGEVGLVGARWSASKSAWHVLTASVVV